jgi:hypothetical protein
MTITVRVKVPTANLKRTPPSPFVLPSLRRKSRHVLRGKGQNADAVFFPGTYDRFNRTMQANSTSNVANTYLDSEWT